VVGGTPGNFTNGADAAEQFIKRVKVGFKFCVKLSEDAGS